MFIEIDGKLINLDNVTYIIDFGFDCETAEGCIRICFASEQDYIDIKRESERRHFEISNRLEEACLRRAGEQE